MVDDIINFAYTNFNSSRDQAVDVLRSGLAAQPKPDEGLHAARYHHSTCL